MNETIVEYIGGIEVIKAFNQGKNSYEKFSSRVRANAAYYYNWMKKCQFGMARGLCHRSHHPYHGAAVGWSFYTDGSLSAEVFLTTIILSMSIVGPLMPPWALWIILPSRYHRRLGGRDPPEAGAGSRNTAAQLGKPDIALDHVSFGYAQDKEILHNISSPFRPAASPLWLAPPVRASPPLPSSSPVLGCDRGPHYPGRRGGKPYPAGTTLRPSGLCFSGQLPLDDTIRENIRMGRVNATDQEVEQVAKAAGCDGFIRQLEHGYNTRI